MAPKKVSQKEAARRLSEATATYGGDGLDMDSVTVATGFTVNTIQRAAWKAKKGAEVILARCDEFIAAGGDPKKWRLP